MGLDLDPVELSTVLDAFGRRRLLSFDRESTTQLATVEVAHESLFREWDRLARWIDGHRSALQRYEALMAATDEWQAADRHADYLLTGTRLSEFEPWIDDASVQITGRQREFITAGLERRSAEQERRAIARRSGAPSGATGQNAPAGARRCDRARDRRDRILRSGPGSSPKRRMWPFCTTASARSMPSPRPALIGPSRSSAWSGRTSSSTASRMAQRSFVPSRRVAPTSSSYGDNTLRDTRHRARVPGNEVRLRLSGRRSAERLIDPIGGQPELLPRRSRGGAEVADRHDRLRGRDRRRLHLAVSCRLRGRRKVRRPRRRGSL